MLLEPLSSNDIWCVLILLIFRTVHFTDVFVKNTEAWRSLYLCLMENAKTGFPCKRQYLGRGSRGEHWGYSSLVTLTLQCRCFYLGWLERKKNLKAKLWIKKKKSWLRKSKCWILITRQKFITINSAHFCLPAYFQTEISYEQIYPFPPSDSVAAKPFPARTALGNFPPRYAADIFPPALPWFPIT